MTDPRPHKAVRRRRRERGIALIAVLWILVVLALLAANMTQTSRASRQLARNLSSTAEARALADGGVYFAIAGLLEPDREKLLATDGTVYRLSLGAGEITLSLRDERGKIDLNRAPRQTLVALFEAAGAHLEEAGDLADALLDYRDADDQRRPGGAEDDDYRAAGLAHGARDGALDAVAELGRVFGMTGAIYAKVADHITVYGGRRVHRASASPFVLDLLPGSKGRASGLNFERGPVDDDSEASGGGEGEVISLDRDGAQQATAAQASAEGQPRRRTRRARGGAVSVVSQGRISDGTVFVREAIVRVGGRRQRRDRNREVQDPWEILAWRQGRVDATSDE